MTEPEIADFFDRDGDRLVIKSWLGEGIDWCVGDAGDATMAEVLGPREIVVASNFLCHMDAEVAEKCLRNIGRLVSSGGYLFVSGVDLDVREKVARELGWKPVEELIDEIHAGDPILTKNWPCHYSGLEPLDTKRKDWRLRYAAAFQVLKPAAEINDKVGE
jgi:hypothetical protein